MLLIQHKHNKPPKNLFKWCLEAVGRLIAGALSSNLISTKFAKKLYMKKYSKLYKKWKKRKIETLKQISTALNVASFQVLLFISVITCDSYVILGHDNEDIPTTGCAIWWFCEQVQSVFGRSIIFSVEFAWASNWCWLWSKLAVKYLKYTSNKLPITRLVCLFLDCFCFLLDSYV